ncbi:MAG: protein kinase domain-containing protein, partial [Polyangiaceae bacterium]
MDTAQALQLKEASALIHKGIVALADTLKRRAIEFKHTPIIGRTHGVHAEPSTFGLKLLLWYAEVQRNLTRFDATLFLSQACSAMSEAHAQGIVHRDLKPQNLFLTKRPDGSPLLKVLDFGISKLQGDVSGVTATQSTTVMGSPAYMSPEQARSAKHVDARGDIYSLGAILYQLLSGYLPFQADSVAGMLVSIVSEPPIPLTEAAPHVPSELAEIVMQCLSKDREKRPQSARELGMMLAPFAGQRTSLWDADTERVTGKNLDAPPAKQPAQAKGPIVITTMEPSSRPNDSSSKAKGALAKPAKKSNSLFYAIAGGAGLGLIVFFALFFGRANHDVDSSKTATADSAAAVTSAAPS